MQAPVPKHEQQKIKAKYVHNTTKSSMNFMNFIRLTPRKWLKWLMLTVVAFFIGQSNQSNKIFYGSTGTANA